jgi:hypothetical protein
MRGRNAATFCWKSPEGRGFTGAADPHYFEVKAFEPSNSDAVKPG